MTDSVLLRPAWERRRGWLVTTATAVAAPAAVTLVAFTRVSPVLPALLYVAAVCVATVVSGARAGAVATGLSFLALDFYFTEPPHSLAVANAAEGAGLVSFVVVAIGMSQIVARERAIRASETDAHRRAGEAAARTLRLETVARSLAEARTPQQVPRGDPRSGTGRGRGARRSDRAPLG